MKNTVALASQRWDGMSARVTAQRTAARRPALVAFLVGELLTAVALFASGSVPPVLLRSLQLFLRF